MWRTPESDALYGDTLQSPKHDSLKNHFDNQSLFFSSALYIYLSLTRSGEHSLPQLNSSAPVEQLASQNHRFAWHRNQYLCSLPRGSGLEGDPSDSRRVCFGASSGGGAKLGIVGLQCAQAPAESCRRHNISPKQQRGLRRFSPLPHTRAPRADRAPPAPAGRSRRSTSRPWQATSAPQSGPPGPANCCAARRRRRLRIGPIGAALNGDSDVTASARAGSDSELPPPMTAPPAYRPTPRPGGQRRLRQAGPGPARRSCRGRALT